MEQPSHTLVTQMRGTPAQIARNRAMGSVMVMAITGAVVLLLVFGMTTTMKKKLEDIATSVEDRVVAKPPPPPPPQTAKPPPPFIPPPDFQIATEAPSTGITTTSVKPPAPRPTAPPAPSAPPAIAPTAAELIASTRTTPPYPAISQRLSEEGTVQLMVTVGTDGVPTAVVLDKSSGKPRLDNQAIDWVKAHYKWKPCTVNGKPIECRYPLNVKFDLKDVQ